MTHTERILDHLCQIENFVKRVRDELEGAPPKPAGVIARPGDVLWYRLRERRLVRVCTRKEFETAFGYELDSGTVPFFQGGTYEANKGYNGNCDPKNTLTTRSGEPVTGYEDD